MDVARFEDMRGGIYGAGEPGGLLHHGHRRSAEPPALARHAPDLGWPDRLGDLLAGVA